MDVIKTALIHTSWTLGIRVESSTIDNTYYTHNTHMLFLNYFQIHNTCYTHIFFYVYTCVHNFSKLNYFGDFFQVLRLFFRDESSTTHNSTHFLTCVVYVLCICKPKTDMCGHVCHMSTQLFKKCVSKLCIFTEFNQK